MLEVDGSCVYPDGAFCIIDNQYIINLSKCPCCPCVEGEEECSGDCPYYIEKGGDGE